MKVLGFEIKFRKDATDQILPGTDNFGGGGWFPVIREAFSGAWQQNVILRRDTIISFAPVYACVMKIATDIAKMPLKLKKFDPVQNIWKDIGRVSPFAKVLRKPNDYQNRIKFIQQWIISKLLNGNTYVLKQRDSRGIVVKLYVLDPTRVRPLITPDGSIYYQLARDVLSELLASDTIVPSSEIIHDMCPGLFHPLIGTSPLFACALAASQGHHIQRNQAAFFKNQSIPSGILTAPGSISTDVAKELKDRWNENFGGSKSGMVAVLGDGLKYEKMTITPVDADIIEQLKFSGEQVCTAFDMPAFMVGVGDPPPVANLDALRQLYLTTCLQTHIEDLELAFDEGLELDEAGTPEDIGVECDTSVLLRMDTNSRYTSYSTAIKGGFMAPNQARQQEDWEPVSGGDTPYMQQQNYSLDALNRRDTAAPAPASATPGSTPALPNPDKPDDDEPDEGAAKSLIKRAIRKRQIRGSYTALEGRN